MPELPEVETVARTLNSKIAGKKIVNVEVYSRDFIEVWNQNPDEFIEDTSGSTINFLKRRAKFLISELTRSDGQKRTLVIHLRMTGVFLYLSDKNDLPPNIRNHIHVEFTLDDGNLLIYSDYRRLGSILTFTDEELVNHPQLSEFGPEPWEEGVEDLLFQRINQRYSPRSRAAVKQVFLDQRVIAGIGNIYICEALWYAKVDPLKPIHSLSREKTLEIFRESQKIMEESIRRGGTSISDYRDGEGNLGTFQNFLKVYGQSECECGTPIAQVKIGGRNTHYCPNCQQ